VKLAENKHCFLIKDCFSHQVSAGFTKNNLSGKLPQDIARALSFLEKDFKLSYLKQVHSSGVVEVKEAKVYEADALFTKLSSLSLAIRTADCLPLFFEEPKTGLIGLVHMGWRSAQAGILANLPDDLSGFKVVAGVALRKCCYQVGRDFLQFAHFSDDLKENNRKLYFDPISFARRGLIQRGLKPDNFLDLGVCSFCSGSNFFSYRRNQTLKRTLSFMIKL